MAVLQLDAEHRIGQQFDHLSAHLEKFFLGHSNPLFVVKLSRGAL